MKAKKRRPAQLSHQSNLEGLSLIGLWAKVSSTTYYSVPAFVNKPSTTLHPGSSVCALVRFLSENPVQSVIKLRLPRPSKTLDPSARRKPTFNVFRILDQDRLQIK